MCDMLVATTTDLVATFYLNPPFKPTDDRNSIDTTMAKTKTVWFGMKLTPDQKQKIRHLAEREGISAKEAVLRLVDQALAGEALNAPAGSFLAGIEHIVGSVEGPTDLSTNPKYLEGFGR